MLQHSDRTDAGRIGILGAGAWGTSLGKALAENGNTVCLWARFPELVHDINSTHENKRYLPGVSLPHSLSASEDLRTVLRDADMVLFVVPSHATREVAREAASLIPANIPIVSATKGIENGSLMFMDEVMRDELPSHADHMAVLSGPSFAKELAQHLPTAVVVASRNQELCAQVMKRFHTPYLRLYASDDVEGVECGGAMKNVIAIASGIVDGLGFGHNTRAALITRGLAEIARLATSRGGSPLTLAGLAGLGDLVLTCTGELSRNRTVGVELGRGKTLEETLAGLGHVAEGVKTAKSAYDLSVKLGVDMPITREIYRILYEAKPLTEVVRDLMARELGYEFDPAVFQSVKRGR